MRSLSELSMRNAGICALFAARLARSGMAKADIIAAFTRSVRNSTSFNDELVHADAISEAGLYKLWGEETGIIYDDQPDTRAILLRPEGMPESFSHIRHVLVAGPGGRSLLYMAPALTEMAQLKQYILRYPALRQRMRLCPPDCLKAVMSNRHGDIAAKRAHSMTPDHLSAAMVLNSWQGFCFGIGLLAILWVIYWQVEQVLLSVYVIASLLFFGCVVIRLLAGYHAKPLHITPVQPYRTRDLPVYTVLVPLYREARVVPQLVAALCKLNWPATKLDIKLVCEIDDLETRDALQQQKLPPHFEVLPVPVVGPRTKPKALNYALQFARGSFVVVYDAEDRPHKDQLLEAWQAFVQDDRLYGADSCGDGRERHGKSVIHGTIKRGNAPWLQLACVQAPLVISNFKVNYLTRYFAFEYAGLFRGLLPWLAGKQAVLPLGGTSNHLRRAVLEKVGGWDSYNVTEDADLGLRLARFGYRVGVINRPTLEDAPENLKDWMTQRTRWFKGWMQTWLVHMRNPRSTCQQLGMGRFMLYCLYTTGLLLSALVHAVMLAGLVIGLGFVAMGERDPYILKLLFIDGLNLAMAYMSFQILCQRTLKIEERRGYHYLFGIPLYWVLLSLASWRASYQMFTAPHHWEKTPHYPSRIVQIPAE